MELEDTTLESSLSSTRLNSDLDRNCYFKFPKCRIMAKKCDDAGEIHRCGKCKFVFGSQELMDEHLKENDCPRVQYDEFRRCSIPCSEACPCRGDFTYIKQLASVPAPLASKLSKVTGRSTKKSANSKPQKVPHGYRRCYRCGDTFTKHDFVVHSRKLNCSNVHYCTMCSLRIKGWAHLREHEKAQGKKCPNLKCNICNAQLHTQRDLKNHYARHNGGRIVTCDICGDELLCADKSKDCVLARHKLVHINVKPPHHDKPDKITCCICSKAMKRIKSIKYEHFARCHAKLINGFTQFELTDLINCNLCPEKVVASRYALHMHQHFCKYGIKASDKTNTCNTCNEVFNDTTMYPWHQIIHWHTKKEFFNNKLVCEFCGDYTLNENALISHVKRCNSRNKCPKCNKYLDKVPVPEDHVRKCRGGFKCAVCPKRFPRISMQKKHMLKHKDPKFTCKICHVKHKWRGNLNRHMRRQHGKLKLISNIVATMKILVIIY